jgi:hypothetical protein
MKWPPWRHHADPAPSAGEGNARRQLDESNRLLAQARHDVIAPLRDMRKQNNVNELARRLLRGENAR